MGTRHLRLLSLDGGGVRGLSCLLILKALMRKIDSKNPPKPCEYFHMIGGTSTGGLIAIMLGRLRMSIDDTINAYVRLSDEVFTKKASRLKFTMDVQGRFDSAALESGVKRILVEQRYYGSELLRDDNPHACKVFVCATSGKISKIVKFTSYEPRGSIGLYERASIWQAARATSAAPSFFEPLVIPLGESSDMDFVDGATGANNPVFHLWDEARDVWPEGRLEDRLECIVSIGTGVLPDDKAKFGSKFWSIYRTLQKIATETEDTQESFRRTHRDLDDENRYFRFNVANGLGKVGLEEAKELGTITAVTDNYIESQEVMKQMDTLAKTLKASEYNGQYKIGLSLDGVPEITKFVDRKPEMTKIEYALVPHHSRPIGRQVFVLHGMGGIGKTAIASAFARRNQKKFSSIFWVNGDTHETFRSDFSAIASRIPQAQLPDYVRDPGLTYDDGTEARIKAVKSWLNEIDNDKWLLVFDNIDRDFESGVPDPEAFDVTKYFPSADHGSILITTRLQGLQNLGSHCPVGRVSNDQGQHMISLRTDRNEDYSTIVEKLEGLPLALAQAGAYMRRAHRTAADYLRLYEEKHEALKLDANLREYDKGTVQTAWTLSFEQVRRVDEYAARMLLQFSFFDHQKLDHSMFLGPLSYETRDEDFQRHPKWYDETLSDSDRFKDAMAVLIEFSLLQDNPQSPGSYSMHPVLHSWCFDFQSVQEYNENARLAFKFIERLGWRIGYNGNAWKVKEELLPHCTRMCDWFLGRDITQWKNHIPSSESAPGLHVIAKVHMDHNKLNLAFKTLEFCLRCYPPNDQRYFRWIPMTVDMGRVVTRFAYDTSNPKETMEFFDVAKGFLERVLADMMYLEFPDCSHFKWEAMSELSKVYTHLSQLDDAEKVVHALLDHFPEGGIDGNFRVEHYKALNDLGVIYFEQGKYAEASTTLTRALKMLTAFFGVNHPRTLETVKMLARTKEKLKKWQEAGNLHERLAVGYSALFGVFDPRVVEAEIGMARMMEQLGILGWSLRKMDFCAARCLQVHGPDDSRTRDLQAEAERLRKRRWAREKFISIMPDAFGMYFLEYKGAGEASWM